MVDALHNNHNKKKKLSSNHSTDFLSLVPEPHLITDKLCYLDFLRLSSVNKSWRSMYISHPCHSLPHQLPLLMLPSHPHNNNRIPTLYQPTHKITTYSFRVPNGFCSGSSHGWLMVISQNLQICLLNPFLLVNNEFQLPNITEITSIYDVKKMTLSDKPTLTTTSFVVMVIHGGLRCLTFFKPGDVTWTSLKVNYNHVDDVIFYRGKFHFVNWGGKVFVCDLDLDLDSEEREEKVSLVSSCPYTWTNTMPMLPRNYLVELSSGELLLVRRIRMRSITSYNTLGFFVYKLDTSVVEKKNKWIEVQSLNGYALFLGDNSSFSVLASDFLGCKPNCIYFTDDFGDFRKNRHSEGPHDLGAFSLENGSIERHYPLKTPCKFVSPPIWLEPTLPCKS